MHTYILTKKDYFFLNHRFPDLSLQFKLTVAVQNLTGVTGAIAVTQDFFFVFLGPPLGHMKVPRLQVKSELQVPAYTTATAMWDLSHICDLHHSS